MKQVFLFCVPFIVVAEIVLWGVASIELVIGVYTTLSSSPLI